MSERSSIVRVGWKARLQIIACIGALSAAQAQAQATFRIRGGAEDPLLRPAATAEAWPACERIRGWLNDGPLGIRSPYQTSAEQLRAARLLLADERFTRAFGKTYSQTTPDELKALSQSLQCIRPGDPAYLLRGAAYQALNPRHRDYFLASKQAPAEAQHGSAEAPLPTEGIVYTPAPPVGMALKSSTSDSGLVDLKNISNASKCGIYYRYLDLTLGRADARCARSMHCETYSLSPPEDDASQIKEQFTILDQVGFKTQTISTGRVLDRSKVIPIPYATDPSAFIGFPETPIDLLLLAASVGDVGSYLETNGERYYCTPHNYTPIFHEKEGAVPRDKSFDRKIRWTSTGPTSVCNDDSSSMTMASLSTQRDYESVYSPDMQWIGRGWFNLRPGECMNIDNLLKVGGRAVLYLTINGKALSYPISASYDDSKNGYAGFSGFGDRDTPICVRHGDPFRYQRTLDSKLSRLASCPAGMVLVRPSLIVRNAGSGALVVRIKASGVR